MLGFNEQTLVERCVVNFGCCRCLDWTPVIFRQITIPILYNDRGYCCWAIEWIPQIWKWRVLLYSLQFSWSVWVEVSHQTVQSICHQLVWRICEKFLPLCYVLPSSTLINTPLLQLSYIPTFLPFQFRSPLTLLCWFYILDQVTFGRLYSDKIYFTRCVEWGYKINWKKGMFQSHIMNFYTCFSRMAMQSPRLQDLVRVFLSTCRSCHREWYQDSRSSGTE